MSITEDCQQMMTSLFLMAVCTYVISSLGGEFHYPHYSCKTHPKSNWLPLLFIHVLMSESWQKQLQKLKEKRGILLKFLTGVKMEDRRSANLVSGSSIQSFKLDGPTAKNEWIGDTAETFWKEQALTEMPVLFLSTQHCATSCAAGKDQQTAAAPQFLPCLPIPGYLSPTEQKRPL